MMPCDWIGMVMIRSETFVSLSTTGMMTARPGFFVPITRPNRN
jgi:hypothetical protein